MNTARHVVARHLGGFDVHVHALAAAEATMNRYLAELGYDA